MHQRKNFIFSLLATCIMILAGYNFYSTENAEIIRDITPLKKHQNTAVFAAYSTDGTVSDYVIDYLKALKQVAPNIIYITDNPIKNQTFEKLRPYVNHIEAKRHGEYDWGSYKRGFQWLKQKGHLTNTDKLIFANDSTLLVVPSLAPIFQKMPKDTDFYGITANQDGTYHLQSYFLIFKPQVYNHPAFETYLNNVKAEKDGLTVAYRYEVPFTRYLESLGFKSAAYIPYETLSYLPLNDKSCYPLTLLSKHGMPFLKMRTFTNRLTVQESRRLVFQWLKKNTPLAYKNLIKHLKHINSPYLKENRS